MRLTLALLFASGPILALVAGPPFLLCWILGWVLATPAFLAIAHMLLLRNRRDHAADGAGR
ncbi:MAG TPA: hypothetical protein VGK32_09125 [Vicinamibacterales bacterium]|jgi:hypothetical protein